LVEREETVQLHFTVKSESIRVREIIMDEKSTHIPTLQVIKIFHGLLEFAFGPPPRSMHDANSNIPCK
jgi:hypothetical protein